MIASVRFRIQLVALFAFWSALAAAGSLNETQALRLLRESALHEELQAGVAVARAEALRHRSYPNPSVSGTFEGAGRTDFFLVEQRLAVNGRRGLLRQAEASAVRITETRADHALRQLEAGMRDAFYRLLHAQMRRTGIRDGIAEVAALVDALLEREVAGDVSRFDRLRAEREVAELRTEAAEAEAAIAAAQAEVGGILGDIGDPGALIAVGSLEPGYEVPPIAEALATGLAARSDYRVGEQRLRQLRLEAEAADRLRIPNPVVSGGLKRAEFDHGYVLGPVLAVSVNLPLFDRGQAEKGIAEAEAERTRARRRVLEAQILADVRGAHDQLRRRRRIADEYRTESTRRASELLEIARVAYAEGELGILELLDSYRVAQRTQLRAVDFQAAAKLAEIDFDRSVAKELLP